MAVLNIFLRLVLSASVILLGFQQIYLAGSNQKFIPDSLDILSKVTGVSFENMKIYCMEILYIESILLIYSGLLLIFRYKNLSTLSFLVAALFDIVFINNIFKSSDFKPINALSLLSILGGVIIS